MFTGLSYYNLYSNKKAYSPVKLLQTTFDSYISGTDLQIPVYNRYDHTNLSELTMKYVYKGQENILSSIDIEPHSKGVFTIPMDEWSFDNPVYLEIFDVKNRLVDSYVLQLKTEDQIKEPKESSENIHFIDEENYLTIFCENNTRIIFDKTIGQINEIHIHSDTLSFSGPHLNLRTKGKSLIYSYHQINEYDSNWKLNNFSFKQNNNKVTVSIKGKYLDVSSVEFEICISPDGTVVTKYKIMGIPEEYVREIGIKFELDDVIDSLSWKRDAYWSYYPAGHLSTVDGKVSLYSEIQKTYRRAPDKDWVFDTKSFYYDGTDNESICEQLTNIAKATKENIRNYNLHNNGREVLSVFGNSDISCRIAKKGNRIILFVNNEMDYVDLSWGNFQRNIMLNKNYSDEVVIKIK